MKKDRSAFGRAMSEDVTVRRALEALHRSGKVFGNWT
jgi:hypothetical protein